MELGFDLKKFVSFLLKARNHGYAGDSPKITKPQRPQFNEFAPYIEGELEYVDSYAGFYYAPGQEVIRLKGKPFWNMAYNGGMIPEYHGNLEFTRKVFAFLQKALAKVETSRPFRGPNKFLEGDFEYADESEGDITNFKGTEKIFYKGKEVFRQDYIGGLIIDKS